MAEHRREVAARDARRRRSPSTRTVAVRPRRSAAVGGDAAQRSRPTPRSRSAASALASAELVLVPRHDPAEPGLQRGDARTELVAVQRQRGLEAQRVARPEPGGHDAGPGDRRPTGRRPIRRERRSRRRPRRCSRCRRRCTARPPTRARHAEPTDRGRVGEHRRQSLAWRRGPARRAPPASRWSRFRRCAERTRSVFDAFGMTSNTSSSIHHTMMSSSTDASSSSSRWVYWARPGAILPRSLVSAHCSRSTASAPSTRTVPRWETSNTTASRRQARCSSIVPARRSAASPSRRRAPSCAPRAAMDGVERAERRSVARARRGAAPRRHRAAAARRAGRARLVELVLHAAERRAR